MRMAELKLGPPKCANAQLWTLPRNPEGVPCIQRAGKIVRRNFLSPPEPPRCNERGSSEETNFRMRFDGRLRLADNLFCGDLDENWPVSRHAIASLATGRTFHWR